MPQGKGTYGSKVGRPSKKKYQAGGAVGMGEEAQLEAALLTASLTITSPPSAKIGIPPCS